MAKILNSKKTIHQNPFFTFLKHNRASKIAGILVALLLVAAGYIVLQLNAAGFFAATDPEQAIVSGNAKVVNDTTALGGKAVEFTAPITPPPPPPPSGGCEGSANTPGGSDSWGGCWPGPNNTGVPAGTNLDAYTSPCTINSSVTLERKDIKCGTLYIEGSANVTIKKSKMGSVFLDYDRFNNAFVTIEDSEIVGGDDTNYSAVMYGNYKVVRSEVTKGGHNLYCGSNCTVQDSWVHTPVSDPGSHNNAFFGWGSVMSLTHSVFACDIPTVNDGGCSADVFLKGGSTKATLEKNLFVATPNGGFYYCTYGAAEGETPENSIIYRDNIFQRGPSGKCGVNAPVTAFSSSAAGNVWQNNKYDNGTVINP